MCARRPGLIIEAVSTLARPEDASLLEEIAALVAEPAPTEEAGLLARMEDTLTAGYARALALEAERLRLERRINSVAAELSDGDESDRNDELAELSRRASEADGALSSLRSLLDTLRLRARELRTTAA
jgi:ABC-type phosphate transport system auxiliary subunit